ncbi:hypothetical protein QBC38DRAFT_450821 [Podospora fimiseda]|uniref:Uncharacterized protein n=1 Tax=Podospora fimiseda TaxID=252190 RepID=A0AAN7H8D9_9PEZI|nr:hypothetical protein QBC38DRAFT_450821 [Podospora fimiseda]
MPPTHNWSLISEFTDLFPPGRSGKGTKGPRPLTIICTRVLAEHFQYANVEDIQDIRLPERFINRLDAELDARRSLRALAFEAWKNWLKLCDVDGGDDVRFHQEVDIRKFGTHDLPLYTKPLVSHSLDFIVRLNIQPVSIFPQAAHQLLSLTDLPNLVRLVLDDCGRPNDVNPPPPAISDRLIRGWSEKPRPFPRLASIDLMAQPGQLTRQALRYASIFPLLLEFIMSKGLPSPRRGEDALVRSWGWDPEGAAKYHPMLYVSHKQPCAFIYLQGETPTQIYQAGTRPSTFYRLSSEEENDLKRKLGSSDSNNNNSKKGPKPRPPKRQNIGDMLSGLGAI